MTLEGAFWGSEVAIFGLEGGMDDWAFVTALTSFLCQSEAVLERRIYVTKITIICNRIIEFLAKLGFAG